MRLAKLLLFSAVLCLSAAQSDAQVAVSGPTNTAATAPKTKNLTDIYTAAPGFYGTSWGVPGYGTRQTFSTFSSPYGGGYGYGYAPATLLPGQYGVGMWNPGARMVWRSPYYGTYATPAAPSGVPLPPFGVYAPAFGPGIPPQVYGK